MTQSVKALPFVIIVASMSIAGQEIVEVRLVHISARLDVRALSYSQPVVDETVVFTEALTDSVRTDIGVGNSTDEEIEIGNEARPWWQAFSFRLRAEDDAAPERIDEMMRARWVTSSQGRVVVIPARSSRQMTARLETVSGIRLSPGKYELQVELQPAALNASPRRFANILSRRIRFEIREPRTHQEVADAYLQLGYQSRLDGRETESRQWASRVLVVNPSSIPATVDLASSHLNSGGNCSKAVPLYRRAIELLTTGADVELHISHEHREELAQTLRGTILQRCGAR
jgi:hypothetical protein